VLLSRCPVSLVVRPAVSLSIRLEAAGLGRFLRRLWLATICVRASRRTSRAWPKVCRQRRNRMFETVGKSIIYFFFDLARSPRPGWVVIYHSLACPDHRLPRRFGDRLGDREATFAEGGNFSTQMKSLSVERRLLSAIGCTRDNSRLPLV